MPVGPTRLADRSTSIPPPEPRSSTVSPGASSASAVGLPQPRDAATAAFGSAAVSLASYSLEVTGSHSDEPPQHEPPLPLTTLSATCPYFSFTICLMSLSLTV